MLVQISTHSPLPGLREAARFREKMRRFVADAGHELRTPLTSIKGFAELYQRGAVTDADDAFRRVSDEATRMSLLVSDLLMLANLDAARPVEMAPVLVADLAVEAVFSAQAAAPDREMELDLPGGRWRRVAGRTGRPPGSCRSCATSSTTPSPTPRRRRRSPSRCRRNATPSGWRVRDDGPGLTPDEAARVFDRFYRGDSSRHRRVSGGGNGLGLSIVSALVAAHGGTVGVDSAPGKGATFWVDLPAAPSRRHPTSPVSS